MTIPRILGAILGIVSAGTCVLGAAVDSPTVELTMIAPWSAPDLLIEIAETVATHNETAYFKLIPEFVELAQKSISWNDHQVYNEAVKVISIMGTHETNFIKIALAIHAAAPRIESYNQYYTESIVSSVSQYDDQCQVWAQVGNKQYCDYQQLLQALENNSQQIQDVKLLSFDHIVRPSTTKKEGKTVVLYTSQFTSQFAEFHNYLSKAVENDNITYVLRYRPPLPVIASGTPLYLSGYGVEMALKKTDYLVIDDRTATTSTKESFKEKVSNMGKKMGQSLFHTEQKSTIDPVTPKEMHDIGLKAAQYIAKSSNPLETMTRLSQDFPKYAKSIAAITLEKKFKEKIMVNQRSFLRAGMNAMWLNGKGLELSQIDPFYLVRAVRNEYKLIGAFEKLGFTAKEAINIISHEVLSEMSQMGSSAVESTYDVRDTPDHRFITWWNDLEKDDRYKGWPSQLADLLKPTYPGQLPSTRRNAFNLVFVEDLSRPESLARITTEVQSMISRLIPIRFGLISIVKDQKSESAVIAKSLNYLNTEHGKKHGMNFLTLLLQNIQSEGKRKATLDIVEKTFSQILSSPLNPKSKKKNLKEALESQDEYGKATLDFLNRMDIEDAGSQGGIMFLNGKLIEFGEEMHWTQILMPVVQRTTQALHHIIYTNQLPEEVDLYDVMLELPGVLKARNSFISPSNTNPLRVLGFDHTHELNEMKYFKLDSKVPAIANLWIIGDFNTLQGLRLANEAILALESFGNVQIAFVHNPTQHVKDIAAKVLEGNKKLSFSDLLYDIIYTKKSDLKELQIIFADALKQLEEETVADHVPSVEAIIPGSPIIEHVASEQGKHWSHIFSVLEQDGLSKSFIGAVVNGRVIGPLPSNIVFTRDNFESLIHLELEKRVTPVVAAIVDSKQFEAGSVPPDITTKVSALIEEDKANTSTSLTEDNEPVNRHRVYTRMNEPFAVEGDKEHYFLEIGLIIDPISETAQKWAPIVHTLSEMEGVCVKLYLNPNSGITELPLKRFYRYVFDKELQFDKATGEQTTPTAYFEDLPIEPLYTLGVETTNAWHVTVKEANMDLDNILLTNLEDNQSGVSAVYELESILIEGHCLDSSNRSPPRGLEFEISSPSNSEKKDTLVMANLGYFQLKAHPGVWRLGLRDGRSTEVYAIESIDTNGKWNYDAAATGKKSDHLLALTSFEGLTVMSLVHKNPGMENEDVLSSSKTPSADGDDIWSSIHNLFGKANGKKDDTAVVMQPKQAEINIFSVASGKLYERFLSIMMASVMKHTESTVKFWFIENFLSPEFKDFVPHLAKEYGFDYQMVTYKWPAWLRAQREKQRIIWGYKILFLDVLFPLDLDKVIFVDADQIVRTDLKELVDMDLQGAPYGYTPFCSDRKEMDGFRFWSEGYWKNHLDGKPYHISALYVVDLVRFRQLAAGDRLRAQYQQLSADPNSLANLDQDLPNNMQHVVPIFSLPQEWLWCETWCSDESLKTAKTIDLCNNPLTKEPKLDRARRQIPEWETYDDKINTLRQQVATPPTLIVDQDQIIISKNHKEKEPETHHAHIKDEL